MVLADTNIFIDFWNTPTKELVECFENHYLNQPYQKRFISKLPTQVYCLEKEFHCTVLAVLFSFTDSGNVLLFFLFNCF